MNNRLAAADLSGYGRGPDEMLVHMSPKEVAGLQALAQSQGTSLTINPETGLPEAGVLDSLLPALVGGALNYFAPGVGTAIGGLMGLSGAAGTGIAVGALGTLASGSLGKGLMAGLGAYGGASAVDSVGGLGAAEIGRNASESAVNSIPFPAEGADAATREAYNKAVQESVANRMANSTMADRFSAGIDFAKENPKQAMKSLFKPLATAAAPIFAGEEVKSSIPTVTPQQSTGYIREYQYDPMRQQYTEGSVIPASDYGSRRMTRSAANGGLMSLADGGIAQMYQDVLGRAPDTGGAEYWQQQFGNEIDPTELAAFRQAAAPELAAQTAAQNAQLQNQSANQVTDLYKTALDRAPDAAGLQYWTDRFGPEIDASEAAQFRAMAAPEISARQSSVSGTDYTPISQLNNLYMQELQRPGEQGGMEFWQKTFGDYIDPTELAGFKEHAALERAARKLPVVTQTELTSGVGGTTGAGIEGGGTVVNPNGTITTSPVIPGIPVGGFTGMKQVRDAYTSGGGQLGITPSFVPKTMAELNARYPNTGDSKAMYDYLLGKGPYPTRTGTADVDAAGNKIYREVARPYNEAVLGMPANPNKQYLWDAYKGTYSINPDYVRTERTYDPATKTSGTTTYMSINEAKDALSKNPLTGDALADWSILNNVDAQTLAEATGMTVNAVNALLRKAKANKALPAKNGGLMALAKGGLADGGAVKEYVDSSGQRHIWDFVNGMYRAETMVKGGITYRWNPTSNKYEAASGNAGVDTLMNNQTGGPGGGQDFVNTSTPDWGTTLSLGQKLSDLGLNTLGDYLQSEGRMGINAQTGAYSQEAQNQRAAEAAAMQGVTTPAGVPVDGPMTRGLSSPTGVTVGGPMAERGVQGVDLGPLGGDIGGALGGAESSVDPALNANGGMIGRYASGGLGSLGGYSDGGRLLRGPGDGVSDSIPASIGGKRPARLADGEFVVPARIVSELGNGSTEAGARKLYAMMDRIQANRRKTVGKNRVAVNSKSHKYLPA